ncbi:MAG: hypothetical protein ABEK16_05010 [Candidatus Nanohalobium sp.]
MPEGNPAYSAFEHLDVSGEEVVAVLDDGYDADITADIVWALEEEGNEYVVVKYDEPDQHGAEPPEYAARIMEDVDVVLAPTSKSISHTEARLNASEEGTRIASMPAISQKEWSEGVQADIQNIKDINNVLKGHLEGANEINIRCPNGTDYSATIDPSYMRYDDGDLSDSGSFGNLPAGEVFTTPIESEGKIIADLFDPAPKGTEISIEGNYVGNIESPKDDETKFEKLIEERPEQDLDLVAEVGIGTNPRAEDTEGILQRETLLGTAHIAFGSSAGLVPEDHPHYNRSVFHYDNVIQEPTVAIDGEEIITRGEPQF